MVDHKELSSYSTIGAGSNPDHVGSRMDSSKAG